MSRPEEKGQKIEEIENIFIPIHSTPFKLLITIIATPPPDAIRLLQKPA